MSKPLIHSLLEEHHFDEVLKLLSVNPKAAYDMDDKGKSPLQLSFHHEKTCLKIIELAPKLVNKKDNAGNLLNMLNVGTGKEITIKELSEKIAEIIDYQGDIIWDESKPDGVNRKVLDVSRIKSLGWEPKIKLSTGLRSVINNYQDY